MGASLQIQIFSFLVLEQFTETSVLVSQSNFYYFVTSFILQIFLFIVYCTNGATNLQNELGDGGYVVCYEMADIEKQLGFGRNSLVISSYLVNLFMVIFSQGSVTIIVILLLWQLS